MWLAFRQVIKHKLIAAAFLVNVGSLGLLGWANQPASKSYPTVQIPARAIVAPQAISGNPAHITVPSVGIDIAVAPGTYDPASATWTLSEDKAYFAAPTAPIQDKTGNVLIYGHSNWQVFAILPDIAPGAQAEVVTDNGHKFLYTYESATSVDPADVSVFAYKGPSILTLQTCTGSWYQQRTLWRFSLTKVTEYVTPTEQQRREGVALVIKAASSQSELGQAEALSVIQRMQAAQTSPRSTAESTVYSQSLSASLGASKIGQPMVGPFGSISPTVRAGSPVDWLLTYSRPL